MNAKLFNESAKANQVAMAKAAPSYAAFRHSASARAAQASALALFWSVFGPAARYSFQNTAYQYNALKKRN